MVDEQVWKVENEGNLARSWEQRLRPKEQPQVHRGRRRVWKPWVKTVAWVGSMWAGAMVASVLAIHVMSMSYHYDQMNNQYAALTRQNQSLQMRLASLTTAQSLAADAARLKVTLIEPNLTPATPAKSVHPASVRRAAPHASVGRITAWIQHLSQTL